MLERWTHRDKIPAIHSEDFERIISELGLFDRLSSGELHCIYCDSIISLDSVSCIFMEDNKINICCEDANCVKKLMLKRNNLS